MKAGDIVKVKVMEVDVPRKRIGLSMRMGDTPEAKSNKGERPSSGKARHKQNRSGGGQAKPAPTGAMAALFEQAKQKTKGRL